MSLVVDCATNVNGAYKSWYGGGKGAAAAALLRGILTQTPPKTYQTAKILGFGGVSVL